MRNKTNIFEQDAAVTGTVGASTGAVTAGTAGTAGTAAVAATRTRQQNINSIYCSVRNGIITNKASQFRGTTWVSWSSRFVIKPEETTAAETV